MSSRLRKYHRKDYSQIVEFPVEIVGRDNLVRRYSYDEAVRLYQRRIHSAPVRYDDPEMIDAEVRHCRQRIDQLRRSYLEHTGWGWARATGVRGILGSPLAAEVAAFLRRAFADDPTVLGGLSVTLLETGPGDVCFLRPARGDRSFLLYAWRFDAAGPPGAREDYSRTRARLSGHDPRVERALEVHEGPDVALILAGEGDWEPAPPAEPASVPWELSAPDPWREATRALHDGDIHEALRRFEAGMERWPGRRLLAQSAAIVAFQAREVERAEFAARYGALHHPDDPMLVALLTVALFRQGRGPEARAALARVEALRSDQPMPLLLLGLTAILDGRLLRAWSWLGRAAARAADGPYYLQLAARLTRLWLVAAVAAGLTAPFGLLGAVELLRMGHELGAGALAGLTLGPAGLSAAFLHRIRRAVWSDRYDLVRLVSPELLPRENEGAVHN